MRGSLYWAKPLSVGPKNLSVPPLPCFYNQGLVRLGELGVASVGWEQGQGPLYEAPELGQP